MLVRSSSAFGCIILLCGVSCYSPDYDLTGTYELRWTREVFTSASQARTSCERPLGPTGSATGEMEVVKDRDYAVIIHYGCRVRVERRGSVLRTNGFEKCELVPGSQAEALGWKNRHYDLEVNLGTGELLVASTNLGEDAGGSCVVSEGNLRRAGTKTAKGRGSRFWRYEGTGSSVADRYEGVWMPSGYIEERADGTLYVQGLGCTLPGRTPPGETAEVPDGACRTGVFAEYGAPELVAQRYSFNDTEFSMSGEYHGVDRDYTFEIQSTSLRPDDWDSRHE